MNIEWKLFGKVVHNPALFAVSVAMTSLLGLITLALSPVLFLGHLLLRKLGRNGFYFNNHIWIGKDSFVRI